ncbi:MAG: branched-chain amino acid ABC transporter permease [Solirubrobacterales bacterium]
MRISQDDPFRSRIMELLLTVLASGVLNGLVYALIGLAFVLIFRVDKIVNLALGECTMIGALLGFELNRTRGLPLVLAFVGVVVVGASIGAITEMGILRRMRTRDPLRVLILTFGLALILHSVARIAWSTDLYSLPTFPGVPRVIRLGYERAVLPGQFVWILALAVVVFAVWAIVLRRTHLGRDLRAVSDDRDVAEAMGIRASRRVLGAYVAACALAAVVGFFVSPVLFMSYTGGTLLGLKGLVAALVGGFFRPMGALVGGLVLGLAEAATAGYYRADLRDVAVFGLLIVLLLVRPQGILPTAEAS